MSDSDLFFALLLGAMILIVTVAVLAWHYIASFRLYRKRAADTGYTGAAGSALQVTRTCNIRTSTRT